MIYSQHKLTIKKRNKENQSQRKVLNLVIRTHRPTEGVPENLSKDVKKSFHVPAR